MTEQRTHVENVRGERVVIAPVQHIGVTGDGVRGWTEALLRGPLEKADQVRRAQRAESDAENGEHEAAAEGFVAVAQALADQNFEPAAASYRGRAAEAYAQAGFKGQAFRLFMDISRDALEEGDLTAVFRARRAREVAPPEFAWEADALKARANWPEQEEGDVDALRRAWEETRGKPGEAEWASALVELLSLNGEIQAALAVARDVKERVSVEPGARLRLELDFLDLLETPENEDEGETLWRELLDWALDPQLPPAVTAGVLQRRGVVLARRGNLDGARKSFLGATQVWARDPAFNDQAAEAFFSAGSAAMALGDLSAAFNDARPLALSLRGTKATPTSRTERLIRRGLRALVGGSHPDALRLFGTAYNLSRRAGNLSDYFQAAEGLGDVLLAGERPAMALAAYIQAGNSKKAAEVGKMLSVDDVLTVAPVDGAPWERIAAWAAIAGAGRSISDEGAGTIATYALQELEMATPSGFPPNASFHAAEALANIVCSVPDEMLARSLEVLRKRLRSRAGDPKRLVEPFLLISLAGRADETEIVLDAMLADDIQAAIPIGVLDSLLEQRSDQQERLLNAAREGDGTALDTVAFSGLLERDEQLVKHAKERVRAAITSQPREEDESDGVRTVSYGIGTSLAPVGVLARYCEESEQRALADSLLRILRDPDPQLPIMTRVSAVEGLHNLAEVVPRDLVDELADSLVARACSPDEPAEWDRVGVDDPLARFRINMAPKDALQTSSLEALSQLAKHHPGVLKPLADALLVAMQSGSDRLLTAGLRVLTTHLELGLPGLDIRLFLMHQSEAVRLAALDAISQRDPDAALQAAMRLVQDPSPRIRTRLVGIAADSEGGGELLKALAEDRDSYTRAMAKQRLAQ